MGRFATKRPRRKRQIILAKRLLWAVRIKPRSKSDRKKAAAMTALLNYVLESEPAVPYGTLRSMKVTSVYDGSPIIKVGTGHLPNG